MCGSELTYTVNQRPGWTVKCELPADHKGPHRGDSSTWTRSDGAIYVGPRDEDDT